MHLSYRTIHVLHSEVSYFCLHISQSVFFGWWSQTYGVSKQRQSCLSFRQEAEHHTYWDTHCNCNRPRPLCMKMNDDMNIWRNADSSFWDLGLCRSEHSDQSKWEIMILIVGPTPLFPPPFQHLDRSQITNSLWSRALRAAEPAIMTGHQRCSGLVLDKNVFYSWPQDCHRQCTCFWSSQVQIRLEIKIPISVAVQISMTWFHWLRPKWALQSHDSLLTVLPRTSVAS